MFQNKILAADRLQPFGFAAEGKGYVYSVSIVDGQFDMIVRISPEGELSAGVYDADSGDEYTLHLSSQAVGAFVGRVRTEYDGVLQKIAEGCFDTKVFKTELADKIIRCVREKYRNEFEFLWKKFPNNAIVRRPDNKKWYVALLTVSRDKIGLSGRDEVEVIDLRMKPEDIVRLVDGRRYFGGYHMNKKHWITICLDGSVSFEEICRRIDDSRLLAEK